jgi:hypothetical protein
MTLDELAETIIGQEIVGMAFNYETETLTLELSTCDLEIDGDGLDMKMYRLEQTNLN